MIHKLIEGSLFPISGHTCQYYQENNLNFRSAEKHFCSRYLTNSTLPTWTSSQALASRYDCDIVYPVMVAVHKLLENVLASLSTDHTLSSWTIFKENNGFVSLKICYKEGTGALNCITDDHFRRKSQCQVMRDRHRSQQWQASRRSNTDGGQHSDQTDTPLSVTAVKVCVKENNDEAPTVSTTTEARDVEPLPVCAMSPAVTRRQTRGGGCIRGSWILEFRFFRRQILDL